MTKVDQVVFKCTYLTNEDGSLGDSRKLETMNQPHRHTHTRHTS